MIRYTGEQGTDATPRPIPTCCQCGLEGLRENGRPDGTLQLKESGWAGFSSRILVKQVDGTRRWELIGKCPACLAKPDSDQDTGTRLTGGGL